MVFQGLDQARAAAVWQPFLDWVREQGDDYAAVQPPLFIHVPAASLWDAAFLKQNAPQMVLSDERPGASATNVFWSDQPGRGRLVPARLPVDLAAGGAARRTIGARPGRCAVRRHARAGA